LLVAGGPEAEITLDSLTLTTRLREREISGSALQAEMIPFLVDPDRSRDLAVSLALDAEPNTVRRPRAVLLANGLHEARVLPGLLKVARAIGQDSDRIVVVIFGAAVFVLVVAAAFGRTAPAMTAAAVGFCSMGWWLVLMAAWQSTKGSVYSEIGALTAAFMAGIAGGSLAASRWRRPERKLAVILVAGSALSLIIAAGVAVTVPTAAIPSLLAMGGFLTGAAFPGLTGMVGRNTRFDSGAAFAADEAGAAAAALAIGVVVIPWIGLTAPAFGLAALQLAAVPSVLLAVRRN